MVPAVPKHIILSNLSVICNNLVIKSKDTVGFFFSIHPPIGSFSPWWNGDEIHTMRGLRLQRTSPLHTEPCFQDSQRTVTSPALLMFCCRCLPWVGTLALFSLPLVKIELSQHRESMIVFNPPCWEAFSFGSAAQAKTGPRTAGTSPSLLPKGSVPPSSHWWFQMLNVLHYQQFS